MRKNLFVLGVLLLTGLVVAASFFVGRQGITGGATGVAKVTVLCFVALSLPNSVVDFGGIFPGGSDNTTDNNPSPLVVQNDGGVRVNVTIERDANSSPLFSGTGGGDNTSSFQFKADETNETGSFDFGQSVTTFTPVPGTTPVLAIAGLNFSDSTDSAEVELLINVPIDEPPGEKQELLNLIALAAEGSCPSSNETGDFVTICHFPQGNPGENQTLTVPDDALPAHLAHGDTVGPCQ